jgi:nucleoside-diphosphate-sugar epimerase
VMATHPSAPGEVFNVSTNAVTSALYVETLADVAGVEADVVLVPDDLSEEGSAPIFSRLFTPRHHGIVDVSKVTRLLGVRPHFDLHSGHADALRWFLESGTGNAHRVDADPLWGRSFDLQREAEVAEVICKRLGTWNPA